MSAFTFNTACSIFFGEGASERIGELALLRIGKRIVFVTDPGLQKAGLMDAALASLAKAGIEVAVFSDVMADPPESVVLAATQLAIDFGADGVIGFGGGSSLDVAKLVALLAAGHDTLAASYGVGKAKGPRLPLLLVPTTAGTGSEVTPIAIVTTGESEKMGVVHITAATGIDAMVHAIEAYASTSANNNPVSRALALEALRLMGGALERAVKKCDDHAARADMLLGSMLAGQAFANSPVASVHALAYPIGGHFHIPHGLSNALVLPHVLRFNAVTAGHLYAEIAPYAFPNLAEIGVQARAELFAERMADLSQRCGLQQRLRDVGIPQDALTLLTDDAMKQTRLLVNNPRPMSRDDIFEIYRQAW